MSFRSSVKLISGKHLNYFPAKFLVLLIVTDLAFILLHLLFYLPNSYSHFFLSQVIWHKKSLLLTQDGGFAEVFQYIKEFWIFLLLTFGYWQRKNLVYLSWALFFGYLLLDDFLSIHEIIGAMIGNFLHFPTVLNLQSSDFGEIIFLATMGIIFLTPIAYNHAQSKYRARKHSNFLIFFLLALIISAVILDVVHAALGINPLLDLIFGLLEDGSEHVVISLTLAFVYGINWQRAIE